MSKKNLSLISILIILILILIGIYFVFGDWSEKVIFTISSHIFVGPLLLILWRIIGIIFPAIPSGVVSFAVVPIFGWFKTYIYTVTGILIGTSISFFLARKFGEPLAERFVPIKKLHRLEDKLTEKQKFLGIVALRLFTVPVMDFSSYAAGLTRISFPKFFLATLIASLPDIAIFYFGEKLYETIFGRSVIIAVGALFFIGMGYVILKRFVFEKK